jgi:hypothetical protein
MCEVLVERGTCCFVISEFVCKYVVKEYLYCESFGFTEYQFNVFLFKVVGTYAHLMQANYTELTDFAQVFIL